MHRIGRRTWFRRAERWMRFAARVLVLATVLLSAIGPRTALAAAQLVDRATAHKCACPHATEREVKSCCCHHEEQGDHALPVDGSGCCAQTAVPPPVGFTSIGLPALLGVVALPTISRPHVHPPHWRLERPPRA